MFKIGKNVCRFFVVSLAMVFGLFAGVAAYDDFRSSEEVSATPCFEINDDGVLLSYKGVAETVLIPENVKSISFGVFADHSEIKNVKFPAGLEELGACAFYGCSGLKEAELPENVHCVGQMAFGNCSSLTRIYLGENVNDVREHITYGCENLASIEVSKQNENYASVDGMLYDKNTNAIVTCPRGKSGTVVIPDNVVTINACAFLECADITEVILGSGVTYIDEAAFCGCKHLSKMELCGNVKKVRAYSFADCKLLKELIIGENVKFVGSDAFLGCDSLSKITFSPSVVKFGENALPCNGELVICGPESSSVQAYALENGLNFKKIDY